ncbi:MAG: DUF2764 family protein, partial [Kiritimatiellae bacterium]|nr:DUF2764 family protein [Kiritimatiellia bacterium]
NAPAPITYAEFIEGCALWISAEECAVVDTLLHGKSSDHPFVVALMNKETILRNALVKIRAGASGKDATLYTRDARGCDLKLESEVEDAVSHVNPLQKERNLDRIRWGIIEELSGVDPLSILKIYAYAAQLAIVTRWSARSTEAGQKTFEELSEVPVTL